MTFAGTYLQVTAMTHRGALRESNEDALVIGPFTACGVDMNDPVTWQIPLTGPVLVAVADGMGGHAAGQVASAHTARVLAATPPQDAAAAAVSLRRIDAELRAVGEGDPALTGLGTTVVGVVVGNGTQIHFGVGDSRIHIVRGGYVVQLGADDRSELSGALTQCLGGHAGDTLLRPHTEQLDDLGGAQLLLCSDGLSDLVPPEQMEVLLTAPGGPTRAVKALWAAAMNASGRDNITIALVEIVEGPAAGC